MTNNTPSQQKTDYLYAYDAHGDVSLLINEGNGSVKESYGYDPYGDRDPELTQGQLSGDDKNPFNPYRYAARRLDSGSQTYDMGARRFGPEVDHFLQVDLFQGALSNLTLTLDPITQNRYAMASGNPVTYEEWDGHVVLYGSNGGAAESPAPSKAGWGDEDALTRTSAAFTGSPPLSGSFGPEGWVGGPGVHDEALRQLLEHLCPNFAFLPWYNPRHDCTADLSKDRPTKFHSLISA